MGIEGGESREGEKGREVAKIKGEKERREKEERPIRDRNGGKRLAPGRSSEKENLVSGQKVIRIRPSCPADTIPIWCRFFGIFFSAVLVFFCY